MSIYLSLPAAICFLFCTYHVQSSFFRYKLKVVFYISKKSTSFHYEIGVINYSLPTIKPRLLAVKCTYIIIIKMKPKSSSIHTTLFHHSMMRYYDGLGSCRLFSGDSTRITTLIISSP